MPRRPWPLCEEEEEAKSEKLPLFPCKVVIISKTFTTAETMLNAKTVKALQEQGDDFSSSLFLALPQAWLVKELGSADCGPPMTMQVLWSCSCQLDVPPESARFCL